LRRQTHGDQPREAGYLLRWRRLPLVVEISVEAAFTRFFAYVVARIVRRHQKRSYPGNVDLLSGVDRPSIWEMSVHLRL
jgi:hypothetical protein